MSLNVTDSQCDRKTRSDRTTDRAIHSNEHRDECWIPYSLHPPQPTRCDTWTGARALDSMVGLEADRRRAPHVSAIQSMPLALSQAGQNGVNIGENQHGALATN